MHQLEIYIDHECSGCVQAISLAAKVEEILPQFEVRILDLTHPNIRRPDCVFATPTYLLDGRRIWLGNPELGELLDMLREILDSD